MSRIGDVLNGDMDMNPTIRPVLDLGAVTDSIGTIDSLFNKRQGLSVTGVVDKASYTLNNLRNNSKVSQNGSSQSTPMVTDSSQSPIYVTVVSELDGREIARVTAPAMSEELYNLNKRKLW
jgi:phage-related protein